ncbi:MAG TPA: SDR family oxidoreductase [bacterium]|nr:SDR family oxidoreductase [bacterium]HOL34555.1 SDR family oxidoreductase [bacterium]HPP07541.1 SDR family oxidoreductase [bacterium]
MNIIVVGGAGFLGSHLCDALVRKGDRVLCIDNLITGNKENVVHLVKSRNFIFIEEDIITCEVEKKLLFTPDIVFHLASPASPKDYVKFPIETLLVNSIGTKKCLDLCLKTGAKFLFTSTSEVYGDPLTSPQKEDYWGNVNPIGPRSMYDEAKRFGEAITMAYHKKYGIKTYLPRIFNTYGPRMRLDDGRVIPNFISQAIKGEPLTVYGDGKQTRSFCYVDDLIRGLLMLVESNYHMPVNLGNPEEFTILELAEKIRNITRTNIQIEFLPPLPDDPRKRKPDIELAKNLLGWEPTINLDDGLTKTLSYYTGKTS